MLAAILNKLKGVHVGFLQQVTGMKAQRLGGNLDKVGSGQGAPGESNQTSDGIYQQESSDGSGVGGPLANIRGLCKGVYIRGRGGVAGAVVTGRRRRIKNWGPR